MILLILGIVLQSLQLVTSTHRQVRVSPCYSQPKSPDGERNSAPDLVGLRPTDIHVRTSISRKYESEGKGLGWSYWHVDRVNHGWN